MKANLPHILVIDDDNRLRSLLKKYLTENGFLVVGADGAAHARELLQTLIFDLIILDVMMPHETGTEFLQKFRSANNTPVLMLTAMGEGADRIKGLELGADDYLTKPFEPKELLLRINSILRRAGTKAEQKIGSLILENNNLKKDGSIIQLTTAEESLLRQLLENAGKPLTREEIAAKNNIEARAVDVQITRLRKKIEADPKKPVYIQTVRGAGYKLNV